MSEIKLNHIYNEPCLETIKRFGDNSIDCVITSPPYWQLRDYGYNGQWGLEPTFQLYLEHLWEMMDVIMPKLKQTGTVWINLGDTYGTKSGNMTSGNIIENKIKYTGGINNYSKPNGLDKCLLLLPHRFAIGCIERGWIIRNDIVWAKRNGMPESVTDRFSKKHEYFFFMTKSTDYYFDLDGIREKHSTVSIERYKYKFTGQLGGESDNFKGMKFGNWRSNGKLANGGRPNWSGEKSTEGHINGKNPGSISDFWDIPTKPSSEEHCASYNDELLKKPIIAGCPKGGLVYDPFMGTGTTAKMCIRTGRNFVGSEMSAKYHKDSTKIINRLLSQTVLL